MLKSSGLPSLLLVVEQRTDYLIELLAWPRSSQVWHACGKRRSNDLNDEEDTPVSAPAASPTPAAAVAPSDEAPPIVAPLPPPAPAVDPAPSPVTDPAVE